MYVIRVESKTCTFRKTKHQTIGKGPYSTYIDRTSISDMALPYGGNEIGMHPSPRYDKLLAPLVKYMDGEFDEYIFGFQDLKQLRNWFYDKDGMKNISKYAQLVVYSVHENDIMIGEKQLMFKYENCKRIAVYPTTRVHCPIKKLK